MAKLSAGERNESGPRSKIGQEKEERSFGCASKKRRGSSFSDLPSRYWSLYPLREEGLDSLFS